jgi:ferredoxin-like protein FixX
MDMKKCSKCGRDWPATTDYFHTSRGRHELALRKICRICAAKSETGRGLAEWQMTKNTPGMKPCTACWREWPATSQYFARHAGQPSGLNPRCRLCNASSSRKHIALQKMTGEEIPRQCTHCSVTKPAEAFRVNLRSPHRVRIAWCVECHTIAVRQAYRRRKDRYLQERYGITQQQYDSMLTGQGGGCAICGGLIGDGKDLHVDHCHKSGRVRGLLCYKCNTAIGMLNDDPAQALRLADYLSN